MGELKQYNFKDTAATMKRVDIKAESLGENRSVFIRKAIRQRLTRLDETISRTAVETIKRGI